VSSSEARERLLRLFNEVAPIARTLDLHLEFSEDGRALVTMPYDPAYEHSLGGLHGGMYAVLLDTAGWFTCALARGASSWMATTELSMHLLQPVLGHGVRAEGRLIKSGKRQDVAEMVLVHQVTGELVAHATATFVPLERLPLRLHSAGASPDA
jgi:uncharacterized protein (TIGR00369 family)